MSKEKMGVAEMIKLGLTLVCYAVAACTILAIVNSFTSERIKANQNAAGNKAMKEVFVTADKFVSVKDFEPSANGTITLSDCYVAKSGDKTVGAVIQVSGPTYDKGKIIVGIDKNGTVTGMRVLELSDSPGFGLKANDPTFKLPNGKTFYDQFEGKNAKDGFVAGSTFDAITGATITSNGIADLLAEGTSCLMKYLEAHGNE